MCVYVHMCTYVSIRIDIVHNVTEVPLFTDKI